MNCEESGTALSGDDGMTLGEGSWTALSEESGTILCEEWDNS